MGSAMYYLFLAVACLAIAIFDMNISSEGKTVQCYNSVLMDKSNYDSYLSTLNSIKYSYNS